MRATASQATVKELVRAALARSVELMLEQEAAVRSGYDPEAIHQYRVATRRMRSDLQTFSSLLDAQRVQSLREELRWLGRVVGDVRDAEVLGDRLRTSAARHGTADDRALATLVGEIDGQWVSARAALAEAMASDRYRRAIGALVGMAEHVSFAKGRKRRNRIATSSGAVRRILRRRWDRLASAVDALPPDPLDADLHQVRVLAKRCRYAVEAVTPVFGGEAQRFADAVAKVQAVLGDHQDAVIMGHWLRGVRDRSADEVVIGLIDHLLDNERLAHAHARVAWRKAWTKASAPKLRRWI